MPLVQKIDQVSSSGGISVTEWMLFNNITNSRRLRGLMNATRPLRGALRAFQIEERFPKRLANLCVSLRWKANTTNYTHFIGKPPNYVSPKTWTEKVQWRKVFDRNPLLITYTDKVLAREYMREIAPEVAIPRTLWIGKNPEEIPFDALQEPYVIKPNHSCGQIIYVKSTTNIDRRRIISTCRDWLKQRQGRSAAEWAYWRVCPQLIVEELLSYPNSDDKVINYKFFVISGRVRYAQFESQTSEGKFLTYFDAKGERLRIRKWIGVKEASKMPKPSDKVKAPSKFFEMKGIAERIGRSIDMVRVDLYQVGETIYFSELTAYDGSGYSFLYRDADRFESRPPLDLDYEFGKFWELPYISFWQKIRNCMVG
jgi:hypothetical protein